MGTKTIPVGNKAGERAYEIMQKIAERLWTEAQNETAAFIESSYPRAKTTREWYESGRYHREIKNGGRRFVITYDYREKAVEMTESKEVLKQCS